MVREIAGCRGLEQQLILTGQHTGLDRYFEALPPGSLHHLPCDPRGRSDGQLRECIHAAVSKHLSRERPHLVLVQGDTTSALAGALAARDFGIPLGHIEAGLRSFDLTQPWPEEGNRVAIDALSDILFAPTEAAARNLAADPRVKGSVYVTGNTGIDALLHVRDKLRDLPEETPKSDRRIILVTCHRKENDGAGVRSICAALKRLVGALPVEVVLPLHPNRHVRQRLEGLLREEPHISLVEPLEHEDMVRLMRRCWLILTDSGGLQEEGPALGKPVLVLRSVTERGEAIESENIELVGTDEDRIVGGVASLFEDEERYSRMSRPCLPFGDGRAAPRIVTAMGQWFGSSRSRVA